MSNVDSTDVRRRINDNVTLQNNTQTANPKYGSMLSWGTLDQPRMASNKLRDLTPNQVGLAIDSGETQLGNTLGEDIALSRNDDAGPLDSDIFWEMNYHEAAIYLQEGRNNEKFDSHPKHPEDLPAYLLVHNNWYYGLDLLTSVILLALAFVEEPAVPLFRLPVWAHGTIELLALISIGVELTLKLRWIGWRTTLKHKRTMLKCATLIIMFVEALTVLARQSSHFRVTRALRPIFLVDTKFCGGVRRFIRQILQTLPPIIDMLGLLLFFILAYMVLGYFLFSDMNRNFATLPDSFVSLFVLLTTANFPDVMMASFSKSKWYALFFISYLCTMLYVMMNLMLAVVSESFTTAEREKFKKLFLHKRKACQHAFKLLVSKQSPDTITFRQFEGVMRYYAPQKPLRDIILIFHYLNSSGTGVLNGEEFLSIYDAEILVWERQYTGTPWYNTAWPPLQYLCQGAQVVTDWKYFEHLIYVVITCNATLMGLRIVQIYESQEAAIHAFAACWDTLLFGGLFLLEALTKILSLGPQRYLNSGWNLFDLTTSIMTVFAACVITLFPGAVIFVIFRPLRTLRLFKMKKRYRDVFGTLVILTPLMCSTAVVMLVLYYFFAIIGMELFAGHDMRNCCKNSTVEDFYKYSENSTSSIGYYYLNTFDNLMASGITLFELTVVNNWFILMNAYTIVVGQYTRMYFMVFYLITMIVLTIVVSSFLEAFRFRIQYKKSTSKKDEEKILHEEVDVKWDELQNMIPNFQVLDQLRYAFNVDGCSTYIGSRPRTRDVLQRRMYIHEICEWLAEAQMQERQTRSFDESSADQDDAQQSMLNALSLQQQKKNVHLRDENG